MPYDDLHCSFDKITRCVELGIDVLVDDSPVNIVRAREAGIVPATLLHPWNEEVVERDGVIGGARLAELRADAGARCWGGSASVAEPLQHRDLVDLRRLEVVPEDPGRALVGAVDLDHRARRGHQVHRDVVGGHQQVLAQDLDRVDGGGDDRAAVDLAASQQQRRTRGRRSRRPCPSARP